MTYPIALPPEAAGNEPERVAAARPAIATAELSTPVENYPAAIPAFVQPKLLLYGQLERYGTIRAESAFRAMRRAALAAVVRQDLPTDPGMDSIAKCTVVLDSLAAQRATVRAFVQGLLHPVFEEPGYLESSAQTLPGRDGRDSRAVLEARRSSLDALVDRPEIVARVGSLASEIGRAGAERAVYAALDVGVHCRPREAAEQQSTAAPSVAHSALNLRDRFDRAAAAVSSAAPLEDGDEQRKAVRRLSEEITPPPSEQDSTTPLHLDEPVSTGVLGPAAPRSVDDRPGRSESGPLFGRIVYQVFQTGGYGGLVYPLPEAAGSGRSWLVNPWWTDESIACPYEGAWNYEQLWERVWLFEHLVGQLLTRSAEPGTVSRLECPFCALGQSCGADGCRFDAVFGGLNRRLHACVQRLATQLPDSSRRNRE